MKFEFKISNNLYESFLLISNDTNSLHVDEEYAKKYGFEGKVVYGNLLNVFISYIVGVKLGFENVILINQTINYRKPIYINDKIIFSVEKYRTYESINSEEYIFKVHRVNELLSDGKFMIKIL